MVIGPRTALGVAWVAALAVAALAAGAPVEAQQRAALEANATYPEGFGALSTVRELRDGRVIVADPLGQIVAALDLDAGTMEVLGREGAGPGEYRQPDAVHPLPGDSTLLVDLGNARLTVIGPDGAFGETAPLTQGTPGLGDFRILLPRGTDGRGRVYYQSNPRPRPGSDTRDSASVIRWDRATDETERLARVKPQGVSVDRSGGRNDQRVMMRPVPLSPEDDWAVGPDGRVALIRVDGYRVEWLLPNGRRVTGPATEYDPVRVGRAEKEAWVSEVQGSALNVGVTVENGQRQVRFGRGMRGAGQGQDLDAWDWPDRMPPFRAGGALVSPAGHAWVERSVPADAPRTYDVFDAAGRKLAEATVPAGASLIGFGDGVAYGVRVDDVGLNWLERYPLPGWAR